MLEPVLLVCADGVTFQSSLQHDFEGAAKYNGRQPSYLRVFSTIF